MEVAGPLPRKKYHFCPQNDKFGCIFMQLLTTIFILFYFLFNWQKIWVVTRSLRMRISRFNRKMKLTKTVQKISKNSWSNLRGGWSHNCPPCIRHCQHPCSTILLLFGLVWFFYLNILIPFLIFYLFTSSLLTRNLAIANKLWSPSHNILLVKYNSRYTCSRMMFDYYNWLCTSDLLHFEIQTVKQFIVPEVTLKGHSSLSATELLARLMMV